MRKLTSAEINLPTSCCNTPSAEVNSVNSKVQYLSMENELLRKLVAEMEDKNEILKAHINLLNENLNFHIKKHHNDTSTSQLSRQASFGSQKSPVALQASQCIAKQVEEAAQHAELSIKEDGLSQPKYERQQTTRGKTVSTQTDTFKAAPEVADSNVQNYGMSKCPTPNSEDSIDVKRFVYFLDLLSAQLSNINNKADNDFSNKTFTREFLNQEREVSSQINYDSWNNENKLQSQIETTKTCHLCDSAGHTDIRTKMPSCKGDTDSSFDTRTVPTLQSNKTTRVLLPDSDRQSKEQTNVTKGRKSMGDSPILSYIVGYLDKRIDREEYYGVKLKTDGDSPFGSRSSFNWDKDFEEYDKNYRFKWKRDEDYKVVKEMQQDLFLMGGEYALAHCVAEDLNMESGIAVSFRFFFKRVDVLLKQNQKQGGLAVLHIDDGRYIYYLITKQKSSAKPTLETMFRSVKKLRDHMVEHKVGKLAIPRLGCGLDRLEWSEVKNMLEFLFKSTDIEIVVCNFQQAAEVMQQKNVEHYRRKCQLVHCMKPIIEAENYTLIIYLGFEDGYISPQIEGLEKKFNIAREYKATKKSLGKCIEQFQMNKDYVLYGCIVQKDKNDEIHFDHLINCLKDINKKNKKFVKNSEGYDYVALQTYFHKEDPVLMDKIINLARNTLHDITLCIHPE